MPPLSTRRLWRNSTGLFQQIFHKTRNWAIATEPIDEDHAFSLVEHALEECSLAGHWTAADEDMVA
jgi:hypothetical protein